MMLLGAAALAVVIAVGAWVGMGGAGDDIGQQEVQSRLAEYQALVAGPGMEVVMVSAQELDQAIDDVPLAEESQREQLREQVATGQAQLAWLTLWDTHAEDGDILRFDSDVSFPLQVTALKTKTTIAIPYPPSGVVKVTGVYDGGGGITIALESGVAHIAWPTMQPGDTLDLPVTPAL